MAGKLLKSPWFPVGLLLSTLVTRWLPVVGLGDFPGDYDYAARLVAGQWMGRDFYMAYQNALSWYNTALLLKLFGGHYLGVNVAVWLWWTLNILAAVWLLRWLGASQGEQAFGVAAVALLTVPVNTNFVVMNFFSSALATASVALFIGALRGPKDWMAMAAGVVAGVAAVAKATAGVGVFGGALGGLLVWWLVRKGSLTDTLRRGALLTAGLVVGVALPLAVLGAYGGYGEVFTETFLSAGTTKGSPFEWVLRTFPRVSLVLDSPYRYGIEAALIAPVLIVLAVVFWRCWRLSAPLVRGAPASDYPDAVPRRLLWVLFALVLTLSLWSLFPMSFPHTLDRVAESLRLISFPETLNHLLYSVVYVALGTYILAWLWRHRAFLLRGSRPRGGGEAMALVMAVVALLALIAIAAGGRYGSVYVAGVFVPAVLVMTRAMRQARALRWLGVGLALWTVTWHVAPNWPSTFATLTRLPDGSLFAGMYFPEGGSGLGVHKQWSSSATITQLYQGLAPRIAGKEGIWMVGGFQGAFGDGLYTPTLVPFDPGHPLRNERRVAEAIQRRPPEFIITQGREADLWDRRPYSNRRSFFYAEMFRPWLERHYGAVWATEGSEMPLVLWELRGAP